MRRCVTFVLSAGLLAIVLACAGCGDVPDYRKYTVAVINNTGQPIVAGRLEYIDGDYAAELGEIAPDAASLLPGIHLEDELPQRIALHWRHAGTDAPVEAVATLDPADHIAWSRAWVHLRADGSVTSRYEQLPPHRR